MARPPGACPKEKNPRAGCGSGVTSKSTGLVVLSGEGAARVCLSPLNPFWRLKVAWRQKDHFVTLVRRLNRRPGVRRDFHLARVEFLWIDN